LIHPDPMGNNLILVSPSSIGQQFDSFRPAALQLRRVMPRSDSKDSYR
jgi:hypothetical protein